jgi:hypothetical protein
MSRILLSVVLCAALVTQLLAGSGLLATCRCAEDPDSCCQTHRQATARPTCCCCQQDPWVPACCQPEKSDPRPCPCRIGQSPEAVPPSGQVQAERGHVISTSHQAAVPPTLASLASCARARETMFAMYSRPGHRLQSLLCVWTI